MKNSLKFERTKTYDNFVTERIDAIENQLLGCYSNDGNYIIPNEIINELVKIQKVKKSALNSSIFCVSNMAGFGEIIFELKREINQNKTYAKLFLLETVYKINGYLQNTIRTEIASLEIKTEDFIKEAFDNFNIMVDFDGCKEQLVDDEFFNGFCMAQKQYCLLMKDMIGGRIQNIYGKYFQTRMLLLKKNNSNYSKEIVEHYNSEVVKIENYFYKYATEKNRNELLDKCFEDIDGKEKYYDEEHAYKNEELKITNQFIKDVYEIEKESEVKAIDDLKNSDKEKIEILKNINQDKKQSGKKNKDNKGLINSNKDVKQDDNSIENMDM